MIVYRFDNVEAFPLLESYTTEPQSVTTRIDQLGAETILRISYRQSRAAGISLPGAGSASQPAKPCVTLALPLRAIDGNPDQLLLEVLGDGSGCDVFLEAADGSGCGLVYCFAAVDFAGRRACTTDVQRPHQRWGDASRSAAGPALLPLQFNRLRIVLPTECNGFDLGLISLRATGDVRPAACGLA